MHTSTRRVGTMYMVLGLCAWSVVSAGCGDDDGGNDDTDSGVRDGGMDATNDGATVGDGGVVQAHVRFAHLIPGAGAVRACVYQGDTVAGPMPGNASDAVSYKDVTDYMDMPLQGATTYNVRFFVVGDGTFNCPTGGAGDGGVEAVANVDLNSATVPNDSSWTIALFGGSEASAVAFADEAAASGTDVKLRVIHGALASSAAGGPMLTVCHDPAVGDAEIIATSLPFKQASPYSMSSIFAVGGTVYAVASGDNCGGTPVIPSASIDSEIAGGDVITVFLVGDLATADNNLDEEIVLKAD